MELASIEVQQPTPVSSVPLEQPPPVEAAHSPFSLSATGKSLKPRASDRQTPSQEAALSKLKEKATKQQSQSNPSSHPRRVVNYSRQENFMSQH